MKILHLTLKKKWFDMIASGEKKEEYREDKPYWQNRLIDKHGFYLEFDQIVFTNGYAKDAPKITVECLGHDFDYGKTEWGAIRGEMYHVFKLGKILSNTNQQ